MSSVEKALRKAGPKSERQHTLKGENAKREIAFLFGGLTLSFLQKTPTQGNMFAQRVLRVDVMGGRLISFYPPRLSFCTSFIKLKRSWLKTYRGSLRLFIVPVIMCLLRVPPKL